MQHNRHDKRHLNLLGKSKLFILTNGEQLQFKPMALIENFRGEQVFEGYDEEMTYIHLPTSSIAAAQ